MCIRVKVCLCSLQTCVLFACEFFRIFTKLDFFRLRAGLAYFFCSRVHPNLKMVRVRTVFLWCFMFLMGSSSTPFCLADYVKITL